MGIFDSFTGAAQKKQLGKAKAAADGYLTTGQTDATNYTNEGFGQAQGYLQPYAQGGQQADTMYKNALGVNGAPAQSQFMSQYQSADPFRQWNEDQAQRSLMRQMQAQGWGQSGVAALASARGSMERGSQDYQNYMNRLGQYAGQGAQIAGQQSGLAAGRGNALSNIAGGFAQQRAGNEINYGNAMAASEGVLMNNLLGLGGLATKAFGLGGTNKLGGK